jgi:FkbM family methyltransferase
MFDKPLGGTELMYNELMKRLPNAYKERFSIFNYLPYADFSKITIFWNQLSHDQEAVQWLNDKKKHESIDKFVFVSNWQSENYRKIFGIAGYKTSVIKNACIGTEEVEKHIQFPIKICYTSTPWRGLDVLLDAWKYLEHLPCELHVFSSTKIYGTEFAQKEEDKYQHLYDKCNTLKNVIYRGSIYNEQLRAELPYFDIMAYPSTFEETSCISVIEALSAGLRVVCSNIGALPETTEGWAKLYPFYENKERHALEFAKILQNEIEYYVRGYSINELINQKLVFKNRWSWDYRVHQWKEFLTSHLISVNNFSVRNGWDAQIFRECYVENEYEIGQLKSDDVVIDLGTHIGSFSLLAYEKGSRKIYTYEATEDNYLLAKENLKNTNVELFNLAVWRSDQESAELDFDKNIRDFNTGMGRVIVNQSYSSDTIKVKSTQLDAILNNFSDVKLLKIDVEGAEYPILYTSCQLDKIQQICGEFHEYEDNQINGYNFDRTGLKRFFFDKGFDTQFQEASWSNKCGFFKATKIK